MWCKACNQDVPGVYSANAAGYCCPRCGDALAAAAPKGEFVHTKDKKTTGTNAENASSVSQGASGAGGSDRTETKSQPAYDSWEMDERLRHVERVLGKEKRDKNQRHSVYQQEVARLDGPHAAPAGWHRSGKPAKQKNRRAAAESGKTGLQLVTWAALSLGMMAFVCGGVLLGWSLAGGRAELWTLGTPIALAGLVGLLLGLVLQLDRLWHENREAVTKLERLDTQLHDLQTTTSLLTTGQGSPGSAFYVHMAGGANPQLLLSDLKGQLDLLAMKLGEEARA